MPRYQVSVYRTIGPLVFYFHNYFNPSFAFTSTLTPPQKNMTPIVPPFSYDFNAWFTSVGGIMFHKHKFEFGLVLLCGSSNNLHMYVTNTNSPYMYVCFSFQVLSSCKQSMPRLFRRLPKLHDTKLGSKIVYCLLPGFDLFLFFPDKKVLLCNLGQSFTCCPTSAATVNV